MELTRVKVDFLDADETNKTKVLVESEYDDGAKQKMEHHLPESVYAWMHDMALRSEEDYKAIMELEDMVDALVITTARRIREASNLRDKLAGIATGV
jgi:hypothetical protein